MTITKIVAVKGTNCDLYVDGVKAVTLDAEVIYTEHLSPGLEVDAEYLRSLVSKANIVEAREKALNWLSVRDYSFSELVQRLETLYDPVTSEAAARRMQEIGLVNDEVYAEKFARDLLERRGLSLSRARFEMRQKGLDPELMETALCGYEDTEQERAAAVIEKKYLRKLTGPKGRQNVTAALARMGFRLEDIRKALLPYLSGEREGTDEFEDIGE